jgi:hypothetical protein
MKGIDPLHHFLYVLVEQQPDDLFLHQCQYTRDILEHDGMSECKLCSTLVDTQAKVSFDMGAPICDPTTYHSLARLSGLTLPMRSSRCASTCMTPREPHLTAAKHILRYL